KDLASVRSTAAGPWRPAYPAQRRSMRGAARSRARSHELRHPALDEADNADERDGEYRGGDERCPNLDRLSVIGTRKQSPPDPSLRTGRQLGDDGADQRYRDRNFEAGEQERHRRRPAQLPKY